MEIIRNLKNKKRGITLTEILVVLSILGFLIAIVLGGLGNFRDRNDFKAGTELVLSVIQDARQKTLSSENLSQYGVHFEEGEVVIFTGNSYDPENNTNEIVPLSDKLVLTHSLKDNTEDVVFERLTGRTEDFGTITLSMIDNEDYEVIIIIEETGIIYQQN